MCVCVCVDVCLNELVWLKEPTLAVVISKRWELALIWLRNVDLLIVILYQFLGLFYNLFVHRCMWVKSIILLESLWWYEQWALNRNVWSSVYYELVLSFRSCLQLFEWICSRQIFGGQFFWKLYVISYCRLHFRWSGTCITYVLRIIMLLILLWANWLVGLVLYDSHSWFPSWGLCVRQ